MKPLSINLRPESVLNNFNHQIYWSDLPIKFIVRHYNRLNLLVFCMNEKSLRQREFLIKNVPVNLISKEMKEHKHYRSQE